MTDQKPIMPSRAYAMEYGTFLGVAWIAVFALYVYGILGTDALLMLFACIGFCTLPFVAFYFAWRYKQHLEPEERLPFFGAWIFVVTMFVYSCLITGAAEYFYFAYMDEGALVECFRSIVEDREVIGLYEQMGMADTWQMLKSSVDDMAGLSPLDVTLMLFNQNIFVSLILSIPAAFIASMKPKLRKEVRGAKKM